MHADERPCRCQPRERGSVLVEFAFVALLMYMLLAVTVDFGRLFFTAQAVQDAAQSSASELAVIPLPPDMTFDQALADPRVRARVFQAEHLVIDLDNIPGGLTLNEFFDTLPMLNQMLRPVMIFETIGDGQRRLLRYPGALLSAPGVGPTGLTVAIPFIESQDANGVETIRWVPVIEEVRNPNFPTQSPFSMTTPAAMPQRGLVSLRINYPYQASMLSGYRQAPGGPIAPNLSFRVRADDGSVIETNSAPGAKLPDGGDSSIYKGPYGLGRMYVAGEVVRPFRKLLSAQKFVRRQGFE